MSILTSISSLATSATSIIAGWQTYLVIAALALLAIGGAYEYGHYKGGQAAKATLAVSELKATVKGEQIHGALEQKVIKLADPDLDSQLNRWMRD